MKTLLYSIFTIILCCQAFAQTTTNFKFPLQTAGTTATAGSQSDTSLSNRGVNGISLRLDAYLGRWFSNTIPNDTMRNIQTMVFGDSMRNKVIFLSNGNAVISLSGSIYRPSLIMDVRDSGYQSNNISSIRMLSHGGTATLAQIGVGGDGAGFISGRRQSDSTSSFGRFFASWYDSTVHYAQGSEVARFDNTQFKSKRDIVLDSAGNLVAPKLKWKIVDVAGGNAVDSISLGISAGALGVRAFDFSNPLKLPSTASNTLSGKSSLLTSSGDTLIWKDASAVINRLKLSGASSGQALGWNGSAWVPTTLSGGGGGSGNGVRFKMSDGSVNIYPDTTVTVTARNFTLANGVGEEGILNTIQNIDSTAAFKVRTITLDSTGSSGGAVIIKNGTGKTSRLIHASGSNNDTITIPNTTGTLALLGGGQTFTSAIWQGTAIGKAYETLMSGKDIQDSLNTRTRDTITASLYVTGEFASYNSGSANSLKMGRGATTNSDGTAVGDGSTVSATGGVALGYGATASNTSAVSVGKNSAASGTNSLAFGASTVSSATSAIAFGTLSSATAVGGIAVGVGASANGINSVALGRGSSAGGFDSSIALNTTATAKHHIEIGTNDTLVVTNGKVKANGVITNLDWQPDSMYVRAGFQRVAKFVSGLTTFSKVKYWFQDSRPAQVVLGSPKAYCKTDSIILEAYQTFDLDSAYFYVEYRK